MTPCSNNCVLINRPRGSIVTMAMCSCLHSETGLSAGDADYLDSHIRKMQRALTDIEHLVDRGGALNILDIRRMVNRGLYGT
jgi:hypothetical protein